MSRFDIEPRNPYFEVVTSIIHHEIQPKSKATFISQVDLSDIAGIRERYAALGLTRPSYTAFVAKAVALALRDHPYANRRVCHGLWPLLLRPRLQRFSHADICVAVERKVPRAEMVAFVDVIRDVDQMSLDDITARLHTLAESDTETNRQWRDYSRLVTSLPSWLAALLVRLPLYFPSLWVKYRGGAVMVSAPGKYGVDTVFANWWAPIGVSFGLVAERPVVRDHAIVAAPTFNLILNFDVRIMAGAQAAHFCRRIIHVLDQASVEMGPWLVQASGAAAARSFDPPADECS